MHARRASRSPPGRTQWVLVLGATRNAALPSIPLGSPADLFPRRYKFDFAVLLAEIVRNKLPIAPFRRWIFVDTLAILDATKDEVGPCLKLQCLVRHYTDAKDLRAHRAAGGTHKHGPT